MRKPDEPDDAEGEDDDRHVLTGDREDRQRVKELVVAEHGRHRIGAAPRVHNRARGVGDSRALFPFTRADQGFHVPFRHGRPLALPPSTERCRPAENSYASAGDAFRRH